MGKGFFTQSAIVLLSQPIAKDELARCLSGFEVARAIEPAPDRWMGGHGVAIAMRAEANGFVVVDAVDSPWPDKMGDPKGDPALFGPGRWAGSDRSCFPATWLAPKR